MIRFYPPRQLFRHFEIRRRLTGGRSFLEVGAGSLSLSRDLLQRFQQGAAVDFHQKVAHHHQRLDPTIRARLALHIGDFMSLNLPGEYDCAVACEVLEHVEDDAAFLRRLVDLLRPGGQLIVSVPAHQRLWTNHDDSVGHLRRYERSQLQSLMEGAGLEQIQIIGYGYPFTNLLGWPRRWLAHYHQRSRAHWSQQRLTAASGTEQALPSFRWLGLLANPLTIQPLAWLAACFNHTDRSDGYLVFARRAMV